MGGELEIELDLQETLLLLAIWQGFTDVLHAVLISFLGASFRLVCSFKGTR